MRSVSVCDISAVAQPLGFVRPIVENSPRVNHWVSFFNAYRADVGHEILTAGVWPPAQHARLVDHVIWRTLLAHLVSHSFSANTHRTAGQDDALSLASLLAEYDALTACSTPDQVWGAAARPHDLRKALGTARELISSQTFRRDDAIQLLYAYDRILGWEFHHSSTSGGPDIRIATRRKLTGTYFTPSDVVAHITSAVLSSQRTIVENLLKGNNGRKSAEAYQHIKALKILDPACGTGLFLNSALNNLAEIYLQIQEKLNPEERLADESLVLQMLESIHGFDIDPIALELCRISLVHTTGLRHRQLVSKAFSTLRKNIICADALSSSDRWGTYQVILGNPPYAKFSSKQKSELRGAFRSVDSGDLYPLFLERALSHLTPDGVFAMIVPLSITFSMKLRHLRDRLLMQDNSVTLTNFDNMPASIFLAGKPEHAKVNRANSQRATIILVKRTPGIKQVYSTDLVRWRAQSRGQLFQSLCFADVTRVSSPNKGFAKAGSPMHVALLENSAAHPKLQTLIKSSGRYLLCLPKTARYFISALPSAARRSDNITLRFATKCDQETAALCLNSSFFYWYWMVYGDGFHITLQTIRSFPLPLNIPPGMIRRAVRNIWAMTVQCSVAKKNSGKLVRNVNFCLAPKELSSLDKVILAGYSTNLRPENFAQYRAPTTMG